ncbi:MAG: hypothetical protein QOI31_644 [Solirubrobacterales bacterium]|jgi:Ca2+-binding RTX toxin-like protein|nr:hypothetical protein [Solirubrobacterales bacterium]
MGVVLPASADAATLDVRETFGQEAVTYIAADGEEQDVGMTLVRSGNDWRVSVRDLGPTTLGAGCEATDLGAICTTSERPRVDVDLGDENDRFDGSDLVEPETGRYADPVVVDGGNGNDKITSISAYSCPDGEDGDDRIRLVDYQGSIAGHGSCFVIAGQGNDRVDGSNRPDFIEGGPGHDALVGGSGGDGLGGGAGSDLLLGGQGRDELTPGQGADGAAGGPDNDQLIVEYPPPSEPDGKDVLLGQGGTDSALYLCGGCKLSLDGKPNDGVDGERDMLDVERVTIQSKVINDEIPTNYGPGNDVLEGGDGDEVLKTKRGEDKLIGGGGEDDLDSGLDDDYVRAADGEVDEVDCGEGEDAASVDSFDHVKNCEIVGEVIFDRRRAP